MYNEGLEISSSGEVVKVVVYDMVGLRAGYKVVTIEEGQPTGKGPVRTGELD